MKTHTGSLAGLLASAVLLSCTVTGKSSADDAQALPIADAHVHYSHDSVDLTPPERVIELMREAGLKFALVSSSDDTGTQLLSAIAPDLIVPGLRPYRQRGELGSWFKDPAALAYVEALLAKNHYASIGEFHLYGSDVELPIPTRIVALAEQHNLVLHAHSDAEAVERLLAKSEQVKVLWAHSGFESPQDIAAMLEKHERLWTDLAFRSEVGSGGSLSEDWKTLFTAFPDRIMLGTDTYTPERMYFIPEHAAAARVWLATLPADIAEKIAWKNAYDLLMPVWQQNRQSRSCEKTGNPQQVLLEGDGVSVLLTPVGEITVSQPFSVQLTVCAERAIDKLEIDASMPAHGHGMNYTPEIKQLDSNGHALPAVQHYQVDGLVFHMPGHWQWSIDVSLGERKETLVHKLDL